MYCHGYYFEYSRWLGVKNSVYKFLKQLGLCLTWGVPVKFFKALWLAHLPASSSGIVDTERIFAELEDLKVTSGRAVELCEHRFWSQTVLGSELVCDANYLGVWGQELHHFLPYFSCMENTSIPQKATVNIKWVSRVKCTNHITQGQYLVQILIAYLSRDRLTEGRCISVMCQALRSAVGKSMNRIQFLPYLHSKGFKQVSRWLCVHMLLVAQLCLTLQPRK